MFALRHRPPPSVIYAAVALTIAWILGAAALAINQLVFRGSGIGPGPVVGIASLVVQAAMIAFVMGGNNAGRVLAVVFLVLAALPLPLAARLLAERSNISGGYLLLGFVLKAVATVLLFKGDSKSWFLRQQS